jgi:hypothetical protein
MKVISKALEENQDTPQPRWWGKIEDKLRYLMRYGHTMLVFRESDGTILWEFPEKMRTVTDKRGINSAKKQILEIYGNRNRQD